MFSVHHAQLFGRKLDERVVFFNLNGRFSFDSLKYEFLA